ncbi:MAG: universal stress protein [Nitriliruptoraceae bacterium]
MSSLRLLVCADTSRAAIEAARLSLRLAEEHGAEVRVVSVVEDGEATRRLDADEQRHSTAAERFEQSVRAMLERITAMGADRGIDVSTSVLRGEPVRSILRDADAWQPDLLLIGRTGRSGPGSPMVGSLAMHVVEFATCPVVVVPEPAP